MLSVLLTLTTSTYVEYITMVDCCVGLIVHCEVSTLLHVASSLHLLVAVGPNPNDGLISLQSISAILFALVIGHNIPRERRLRSPHAVNQLCKGITYKAVLQAMYGKYNMRGMYVKRQI